MMTDIMIILVVQEIIRAEAPSFFSPFSDVNVFMSFVADDRVAPQLGGGPRRGPAVLHRRYGDCWRFSLSFSASSLPWSTSKRNDYKSLLNSSVRLCLE